MCSTETLEASDLLYGRKNTKCRDPCRLTSWGTLNHLLIDVGRPWACAWIILGMWLKSVYKWFSVFVSGSFCIGVPATQKQCLSYFCIKLNSMSMSLTLCVYICILRQAMQVLWEKAWLMQIRLLPVECLRAWLWLIPLTLCLFC